MDLEVQVQVLEEQLGILKAALRARRYNYRKMAFALHKLPMGGATRLEVIGVLCDVLKEDNPRFMPALFTEWALEDV